MGMLSIGFSECIRSDVIPVRVLLEVLNLRVMSKMPLRHIVFVVPIRINPIHQFRHLAQRSPRPVRRTPPKIKPAVTPNRRMALMTFRLSPTIVLLATPTCWIKI